MVVGVQSRLCRLGYVIVILLIFVYVHMFFNVWTIIGLTKIFRHSWTVLDKGVIYIYIYIYIYIISCPSFGTPSGLLKTCEMTAHTKGTRMMGRSGVLRVLADASLSLFLCKLFYCTVHRTLHHNNVEGVPSLSLSLYIYIYIYYIYELFFTHSPPVIVIVSPPGSDGGCPPPGTPVDCGLWVLMLVRPHGPNDPMGDGVYRILGPVPWLDWGGGGGARNPGTPNHIFICVYTYMYTPADVLCTLCKLMYDIIYKLI